MSKISLLLLLLFSIGGLFWGAHGDISNEGLSTESQSEPGNSSEISSENSGDNVSSPIQKIIHLPQATMKFIYRLLKTTITRIYHFFRPVVRGIIFFFIDMLSFLFSSDDTRVSVHKRGTDEVDYEEGKKGNGFSIVGLISKAFMKPFKLVIGSLRHLPIGSIFDKIESLTKMLEQVFKNPIVHAATNVTLDMAEVVGHKLWNFTKISVLPRLDNLITDVRESDALPKPIIRYLTELQTLYHILKLFGLV